MELHNPADFASFNPLLPVRKVAELIGVNICTLRRWEQTNKFLPSIRTPGGHRRYALAHVNAFLANMATVDNMAAVDNKAKVDEHS